MTGRLLLLACSLTLAACGSVDAPEPVGRCGDGPLNEGPCRLAEIALLSENSCGGYGGRETYNVVFSLEPVGDVIVDVGVCLNADELAAARAHYAAQAGTCRHRAQSPCPDEVSASFPLYRPVRPAAD